MFSDLVTATFPHASSTDFGRELIGPGGFFEVTEEDVLGERMAVFKHRSRHLFDLLRNAAAGHPDKDYLADEHRRLTYAQTLAAVGELARVLRDEHGVRPGDRVGIHAANCLEWVVAFWAVVGSGAVVSAMNSYWSAPETADALALTTPRLVLADSRRAAQVTEVAPEVPVLLLDAALYDRLTSGDGAGAGPEVPVANEDDVALLMFTSGTTGRAKAVAQSHRAILGYQTASVLNALLRMGAFPTELPPPPRVLVGPPFFHLSALYGTIVMYTFSAALLVVRPGRFDEERTLAVLQDERIEYWLSVGSSAPRVAAHPRLRDHDLSALKMVTCGGAPVTPAARRLIYEAFPGGGEDNIRMGYSSTEAGCLISTIGGQEFDARPESTGPVQDGLQLEIRDEAGRRLPDGQDGMVFIRSPYTMLGYWRDDEATAAAYAEGRWLSMGDIGRIVDGELVIDSRARDLIFVSSENVYPSEVENRLTDHPAVVECCVAGVDDPVTGQAVTAFVVLSEGDGTTVDELAEWCRGGLPAYKVPTTWHLGSDLLPRSATGKLMRRELVSGTGTETSTA